MWMNTEYQKNVDEILDLLRFMGAWLLPLERLGYFLFLFCKIPFVLIMCGSVQWQLWKRGKLNNGFWGFFCLGLWLESIPEAKLFLWLALVLCWDCKQKEFHCVVSGNTRSRILNVVIQAVHYWFPPQREGTQPEGWVPPLREAKAGAHRHRTRRRTSALVQKHYFQTFRKSRNIILQ